MESFNRNPNNFTKNKFYIVLSNMPNLTPIPDDEIDLSVFNTSVKNVELPPKTMKLLHSYYNHTDQKHPDPEGSRDTSALNIEWILDSKFLNYAILASLIDGSRYGIEARDEREEVGEPLLRDNCIDRIDIYALDNTDFPTAMLTFHRAFLTNLGSLSLEFGTADTVTFTTTFEYEKPGLTIQRKLPDGSFAIDPSIIPTRVKS